VRMPENKVLSKIFASRNEVKRQFRALHSKNLPGTFKSRSIVKIVKCRRCDVTRMGKTRNAYGILVGKRLGQW
jgi:hypothetical protein